MFITSYPLFGVGVPAAGSVPGQISVSKGGVDDRTDYLRKKSKDFLPEVVVIPKGTLLEVEKT
jgi:hypothetical protein